MIQHFNRLNTKRLVIGLLSMTLIALSMQSCTTPARDHYMALTNTVVHEGAPEHDEVAIAFGLPLYQPNDVESVLVEVPTTEQP